MPATDSPAIIVARFLKANNYTESYAAFISEAGLPPDAGVISKGDLTLETLLEEKKTFDVSVRFEKLGVHDGGERGWKVPAPETAAIVDDLPSSSNILSVAVHSVRMASHQESMAVMFVTTADRRLHLLDAKTRTIQTSLVGLQDSPVLSVCVFRHEHLLTASMSGQLLVSDLDGRPTERRRDHSKYIVRIAMYDESDEPLLATAGWDCKIVIYRPTVSDRGMVLGEPIATITLQTKPEAIALIQHPIARLPILLLSRTDSSFLYYYTCESEPRLLGRQNLAPHSNAWVAFTPSALALCPTDPTLLAVGTSSVPHMKLLLVRLLVPPYDQQPSDTTTAPQSLRTSLLDDSPATDTQASQARAALVIADREAAAIQIHCTTMAPQTAYSTPAVAWRPDGSGVWVNGDDGAVRGIEASTGKVISTLKGHEAGSKVRCLWAGSVNVEEVMLSGGFDQKLVAWTSPRA
ncbi:hypothetical protein BAUCODRAFT_132353 [Baudoinia panamericana UAMH 10762]|uniref:LisH domain-containing protein n=1 Tax=Baudoinia panamericana (strain UAMH 10762) TaxID=717646 RepID=M2MSG0_BAUPA|nr:uncharacterized protein BAUCODRAFT_132353 [Baudoinia panamericana UAMH 10762]EMC94443.1 hypothetical protein BAUCODRAFT_132353 [Baudoinia panamericana UAMH 10762]